MTYLATITSKRQFTIPVELFKKANLKTSQKVLLSLDDSGVFRVEPMRNLVKELAGSVKVAKSYRGLSLNQIVKKSREDYFKD